MGESFSTCAIRETKEETDLDLGDIKFLTATNDVFSEDKHYVTVFVTAKVVGANTQPKVRVLPPSSFAIFNSTWKLGMES
jgi:8-oxo-dGTP diphosphatase